MLDRTLEIALPKLTPLRSMCKPEPNVDWESISLNSFENHSKNKKIVNIAWEAN
jgi:hypothetical protein